MSYQEFNANIENRYLNSILLQVISNPPKSVRHSAHIAIRLAPLEMDTEPLREALKTIDGVIDVDPPLLGTIDVGVAKSTNINQVATDVLQALRNKALLTDREMEKSSG